MPESKKPQSELEEQIERMRQEVESAAGQETAPPSERRLRARLFQIYLLVALGFFLALAVLASSDAYFPIDLVITRTIQTFHPAWFFDLMVVVSWPGYQPQAPFLVSILGAVIYLVGFRWEALMAVLTAAGVEALNLGVKLAVHRPRPAADLVHVVKVLSSYSFPSGHVMFFTGFYGFLWFLSFSLLKPSWRRTFLLFLFGAMLVLVGPSRVFLGEHWSSDVLGGYLLGSLCLAGAVRVYRWGQRRVFDREGENR